MIKFQQFENKEKYRKVEGDINNDGEPDKIYYQFSGVGDSMYIFLSLKEKQDILIYKGKNFTIDGVTTIDDVIINNEKQFVQFHLKDNHLERNHFFFKVENRNDELFLTNFKRLTIEPNLNSFDTITQDTVLNIKLDTLFEKTYNLLNNFE